MIAPKDLSANRRYAPRHMLSLAVTAWIDGRETQVRVYDLSQTGFLVEAIPPLLPRQRLDVEFPGVGRLPAEVIWAGETLSGCSFKGSLSQAAISAALLQGDHLRTAPTPRARPANEVAGSDGHELPLQQRLRAIIAATIASWIVLGLIIYGIASIL